MIQHARVQDGWDLCLIHSWVRDGRLLLVDHQLLRLGHPAAFVVLSLIHFDFIGCERENLRRLILAFGQGDIMTSIGRQYFLLNCTVSRASV